MAMGKCTGRMVLPIKVNGQKVCSMDKEKLQKTAANPKKEYSNKTL